MERGGSEAGGGGVIKYSSVCPNLAWRRTSQLHASPAAAADWDKNLVAAAAAVTAHCSVLARCCCGRKAKLGLLPCGHKRRASGDPETLRCSVVVVSRCYQPEEEEGSRKVKVESPSRHWFTTSFLSEEVPESVYGVECAASGLSLSACGLILKCIRLGLRMGGGWVTR